MLYIHIPFCHRKCTYCAFYSTVSSGDRQAYVDALCQELRLRRHVMEHPLHTVYWGGGTPSLLSIAHVEQIVATLRECYQTAEVVEATLEANPEDLTPDYLRDLSRIGFFNRISIGVQSFHDDDLRLLNRRHNARQAVEAVRNAVAAGFDNVSVDLIYGLPGQTVEAWQDNLCRLASLPVCHLSAYALTVEDGTMLARQIEEGRVLPADEEQVLLQYAALQHGRATMASPSTRCRTIAVRDGAPFTTAAIGTAPPTWVWVPRLTVLTASAAAGMWRTCVAMWRVWGGVLSHMKRRSWG